MKIVVKATSGTKTVEIVKKEKEGEKKESDGLFKMSCPDCGKAEIKCDIVNSSEYGPRYEIARRIEEGFAMRAELNEQARKEEIHLDDYLRRRARLGSSSSWQRQDLTRTVGFLDVPCPRRPLCRAIVRFEFEMGPEIPAPNAPTQGELARLKLNDEWQPEVKRGLRLKSDVDLQAWSMGKDLTELRSTLTQAADAILSNPSIRELNRDPEEDSLKRKLMDKIGELKIIASGVGSIIEARQRAYVSAAENVVVGLATTPTTREIPQFPLSTNEMGFR